MLKKSVTVFLLFSFVFTIILADFTRAYAQEEQKQPRIAVLPFEDTNTASKNDGYGRAISGMLMTELINGKVFQVVERSEIERMMQEMAFQISGAVDANTAKQIGAILGVDILVFGTVAKFSRLVETDIRLVDTQTGEALLAENANSNSDEEMRDMVKKLAQKIERRYLGRLVEEVTITSTPAGAVIHIDGVQEGVTPLMKNLGQGEHKIRISKENYLAWEGTVVVVEGGNQVNAALTISPDYLRQQAEKRRLEAEKNKETPKTVAQTAPKQDTSKSGGSNAMLYILGGAVLVGGGIAAMSLLGGDDEKSENTKGSITIKW